MALKIFLWYQLHKPAFASAFVLSESANLKTDINLFQWIFTLGSWKCHERNMICFYFFVVAFPQLLGTTIYHICMSAFMLTFMWHKMFQMYNFFSYQGKLEKLLISCKSVFVVKKQTLLVCPNLKVHFFLWGFGLTI